MEMELGVELELGNNYKLDMRLVLVGEISSKGQDVHGMWTRYQKSK